MILSNRKTLRIYDPGRINLHNRSFGKTGYINMQEPKRKKRFLHSRDWLGDLLEMLGYFVAVIFDSF